MSGLVLAPHYRNRIITFLSFITGFGLLLITQIPQWTIVLPSFLLIPFYIIGGILLTTSLFHWLMKKIDYPDYDQYYIIFLISFGTFLTTLMLLLATFGPYGLAGFFPALAPILGNLICKALDEEDLTQKV